MIDDQNKPEEIPGSEPPEHVPFRPEDMAALSELTRKSLEEAGVSVSNASEPKSATTPKDITFEDLMQRFAPGAGESKPVKVDEMRDVLERLDGIGKTLDAMLALMQIQQGSQ